MSRRTTDARVRRVALSIGVLMAALAIIPTAWPSWSGGTPAAWAETQTISDGATVRAPDRVRQGEKIKITGRGWTTSNGHGSVIAIKLDDGEVTAMTPVTNPATGDSVTDPSVVAAVGASAKGSFSIAVAVPDGVGWTAGTRHSVRLLTGKLLNDDSTRSVALTFDIVAGPSSSQPSPSNPVSTAAAADGESEASARPTTSSVAPPAQENPMVSSSPEAAEHNASPGIAASASSAPESNPATARPTGPPSVSAKTERQRALSQKGVPAEASNQRAAAAENEMSDRTPCLPKQPTVTLTSPKTVRGVPVVDVGGSLTLTGAGFCGSTGGARIAVQIDDGRVARRKPSANSDRKVWQVIDAAEDGTFSTTIRVPDRDETDPDFTDGAHRLRLIAGSLRAGDPSRSVRTIEFVVATGNNAGVLPEPTSVPHPVDPVIALVGPKAGAVTAARTGSMVRVVVPDLQPGDWVYPYVFGDGSDTPKETGSWVQLDADRSVVLDADDVIDGAGPVLRVSLQARDGTMVGWATLAPTTAQPVTSESKSESGGGVTVGSPSTRSPRPLVVAGGIVLMLVALVSLDHARRRRRRLLRDLNDE